MSSLSELAKTYLVKDSRVASRQLWDRLPGTYELWRDPHHDLLIDGNVYTSANNDFEKTSGGDSEIIPRPPTDAAYDEEFLQTTTFTVVLPKISKEIEMTEKRVF